MSFLLLIFAALLTSSAPTVSHDSDWLAELKEEPREFIVYGLKWFVLIVVLVFYVWIVWNADSEPEYIPPFEQPEWPYY